LASKFERRGIRLKFTTIFHYSEEEDPDCDGDYWHVTVECDGEEIARFGDYYHDKGDCRAESFIKGIVWAMDKNFTKPIKIEYENKRIADATY
jgi:hypothetical protein